MLDEDIDGYWIGISGGALSNNDLEELTISFHCWRESLPSLPELSHVENDIICNRILFIRKVNINRAIVEYNYNSRRFRSRTN